MAKAQHVITTAAEINARGTSTVRVVIKRDGFTQSDAMPFNEVLAWFHKQHSYSMGHALEHEGYTVHQEIFTVWAECDREDGKIVRTEQTKFTELAAKRAYNTLAYSIGNPYNRAGWERTTGPAIKF
jgi:hypothetical protein